MKKIFQMENDGEKEKEDKNIKDGKIVVAEMGERDKTDTYYKRKPTNLSMPLRGPMSRQKLYQPGLRGSGGSMCQQGSPCRKSRWWRGNH